MSKEERTRTSVETRTAPQQPAQLESAWRKFLASFRYAFRGLWYAIRTQRNMRVHLTAAVLVIIFSILLHISTIEFAIIFLAISSVMVAEVFNTVIECIVDLASPNYHPLARSAKDAAAGAVLLCAIFSVVIALFIFGPHLWKLISH